MTDSDIQTEKQPNGGISPIIGVILMVAVVVILAALIGVYALELSDSTESNVNAGVETDTTAEGVQVRLNSTGNAEEVVVLVNGSELSGAQLTDAGDSVTVSADENDTVTVVGVGPDGNENTLQSVEPDKDTTGGSGDPQVVSGGGESGSTGEEVTGLVRINPPIEDATVISYDADGNQLATATTDSEGKYSVTAVESGRLVVSVAGSDSYNGNPLYAGAAKTVSDTSSSIEFDFDETQVSTATVNGETVSAVYQTDSSSSNQIANVGQLQALTAPANSDKSYELVRNINASGTSSWNSGSGFDPIGDSTTAFTGSFDGNGNTINGLTIDRSSGPVGLFGIVDDSTIQNVSLESVDIEGDEDSIGGLVGSGSFVTISNSSVSGSVSRGSGTDTTLQIGLLSGYLLGAILENTSSSGTVSGSNVDHAGGLVGHMVQAGLSNSESSANVTGGDKAGGIVGSIDNSTIDTVYATGNVGGEDIVGGLIGDSNGGIISNSYATGNVSGVNKVGGFIGEATSGSEVTDSYATGEVSGSGTDIGGLVGYVENDSVIENSYWDIESSGQSSTGGEGTGLTTSEMQGSNAESNMSGFNFSSVWTTTSDGYPELQNNPE